VAAIVGTILGGVLGGYVAAAALSEPVGPAVGIPGVVSVRPLSGWAFAGRGFFEGFDYVGVTRGSGNLVAGVAASGTSDAAGLAVAYVRVVLSRQMTQLSVSRREDIQLDSGARGVRFGYVGVIEETGASVEGEVSVVVTPSGHGVVFDGWAPAGLLSFVRSDIHTMIERAEVT